MAGRDLSAELAADQQLRERPGDIPGKAALYQLFAILSPEGGPSLLSEWLADWMMARAEGKPDDSPDAMYLTGLNVVIRSDKLLVRMPVGYLESMPEVANRNLLIIGGRRRTEVLAS